MNLVFHENWLVISFVKFYIKPYIKLEIELKIG